MLGHGEDPRLVAFHLGFLLVRPLAASRSADDVLTLSFRVKRSRGEPPPRSGGRAQDPGLTADEAAAAEVRQRAAAYALVTSDRGLLATEFSGRTAAPGRWGLPGGGIGDGEQPEHAVLREVAEETRQEVSLGELVEVQTSHWIGRSPRSRIEDFHAVRLVYSAWCPAPTTPVVVDVGGTTESARWVPLAAWETVNWTAGWREILSRRLTPPA
ncbi:MAG TPA: NUDIX domain-containing protein [Propionibacteriaceae bacterium]|nr:NUDIX domain-containing protein [Propionibacteriaceae bacterium]